MTAHEQFEELYRRHGGRVLAYVLRRASPSVADDVVADVFLVAWRKLDRLPAEPLPWLLGTARKLLANRRRGEERTMALHRRLAAEHAGSSPRPSQSRTPIPHTGRRCRDDRRSPRTAA